MGRSNSRAAMERRLKALEERATPQGAEVPWSWEEMRSVYGGVPANYEGKEILDAMVEEPRLLLASGRKPVRGQTSTHCAYLYAFSGGWWNDPPVPDEAVCHALQGRKVTLGTPEFESLVWDAVDRLPVPSRAGREERARMVCDLEIGLLHLLRAEIDRRGLKEGGVTTDGTAHSSECESSESPCRLDA